MKGTYEKELKEMKLAGLTSRLKPLKEERILKMKDNNPGIPSDYLHYLQDVGYGCIGNMYMVYSGLIGPEEIFGIREDANLKDILLIGDGLSGDCEGYLVGPNWELITIDHVNLKVYKLEISFEEFIKKKIKLALKVHKKTEFKI